MLKKDSLNIAVSSMTNADSFIKEGAYAAMKKLKEAGLYSVEISQHIQFDEKCVEEILHAQDEFDMDICALSVRFNGTIPWGLPYIKHGETILKTYSAEDDFHRIVDYCHKFKCRYIRFATLPGRQMYDMTDVKKYMASLEECCRRYEAEGITMCIHNHADEFLRMEGKWILDWALELAPSLCYEIDCLNAQKSGIAPSSLIRRCGERTKLLHLQDLRIAPADPQVPVMMGPEIYQGTWLGDGNMDFAEIIKAAKEAAADYLIIEQAQFYGEDLYACIRRSNGYLQKLV